MLLSEACVTELAYLIQMAGKGNKLSESLPDENSRLVNYPEKSVPYS
jgi:hypothetical protein